MNRRVTLLLRGLAAILLLMLVAAPPSAAAASITVSASANLQDGQTITISGSGFAPNLRGIAIGECIVNYVGPGDCNLQGGAKFRDADANGNISSFTIVVKEKFATIDCTKQECVIAAGPLPTASDPATVKANTHMIPISFASAAPVEPVEPVEPVVEPTGLTTDPAASALPKTGAGDSLPVLMLGATALLTAGVGVMLLVPGRRRNKVA